jgi:hypothetical protein
MAEDMAADVVDLLAFVLCGDTGRTEPEFPQPAPDVEAKPAKRTRRKKTETQTAAAETQENRRETKPGETKDAPSKYKAPLGWRIVAIVSFVPLIGLCLYVIVASFNGWPLVIPFIVFFVYMLKYVWAKTKKTG